MAQDTHTFGSTPLLERVVCRSDVLGDLFPNLLPSTPNLRTIDCFLDDDFSLQSMSSYPWANIQHLDLQHDSSSLVPVLESLCQASGLQSLSYINTTTTSLASAYVPPEEMQGTVVSNIEFLSFELESRDGFPDLLSDFIQGVTLPALSTLSLRYSTSFPTPEDKNKLPDAKWPRYAISDFFQRSGCRLTTLTLRSLSLLDKDVISLLELTPFVETFTLSEYFTCELAGVQSAWGRKGYQVVTRNLLERLKVTNDVYSTQAILLPKLKSIDLMVMSHFDSDTAFVEMVASRQFSVTVDATLSPFFTERLQTAVLSVDRVLVGRTYKPLKDLERAGMMISVIGDGEEVV
ncbi:hypothetical protein V5O48_016191 [Marasmius crinis-equi]|uniref:Uncharacterized protein n=1 Tax=Marasmius crinis-equi TaxID=585013 RepID=A0ABR3ESG7_9AGAR